MLEINTLSWILAAVVVLFTFLKWYFTRNDDYWKKRGIPYLPRMNLYTIQRKVKEMGMDGFIKKFIYKKNMGRVYGGFEGSEPILILFDPDLLRDVFVKDFHLFPYRRLMEIGDPVADKSVTNLTGEEWKRVRTVITPAFTSKRMRQMGSIINDCTKTVLDVCDKYSQEGKPVDCKSLFGTFTMDVIANSAFGTQIDSHNDPNNEFVRRVRKAFEFNMVLALITMSLPVWVWKILPSNWHPFKFDKGDFFREVTSSVIKKRKESGRRYNDFLQILMDAADETKRDEHLELAEDETDRFGSIINDGMSPSSNYKHLSEIELLGQCVLFFLVGYETSASVLTTTAYSLAVNPEWQEKLINEVDEAFQKHSEMSYDAVREMKILDAVISETLRMHPPLPTHERTAVEDYELRNTGIVVKKGMRIMIPTYGMHYDPEYFEEPETFNPERFLGEPKHPQYAYIPFGMGPRNCLGMRFALLEIKVCLANLLHRFRLKPHSTTKIPLEYKRDSAFLTLAQLPLLMEKRTDVK